MVPWAETLTNPSPISNGGQDLQELLGQMLPSEATLDSYSPFLFVCVLPPHKRGVIGCLCFFVGRCLVLVLFCADLGRCD